MAVIHELPPHLADLIAAGEVVERPASVAKELVENAIDAGASHILVEIQHGGVPYLRIADDGCGIAPEDAPVAFLRHATSKLRTEEDLSAINTLGFRGEALAAIASVSRIDLLTKQRGALAGTHLNLEAGTVLIKEEAGCPEGTTIIVRDLFFNTPARNKFLKKDFTEAGYVFGVVQHAALSHPEIAFTMLRDGKQIFCTAGDGRLMTPVFGVFGRDITENMIEIAPLERDNLCVWGYITKPHAARPNRSMQHFFVNGRYVKNRTMQAALEEAYRNQIITGKYPSCALFLSLPYSAVDVNVHPAKTEIKFASEKPVFEAVYIASKNTLETHDNMPQIKPKQKPVKEDHITAQQQHIAVSAPAIPVWNAGQQTKSEPAAPKKEPLSAAAKMPYVECDDFDDEAKSSTLQQPALQIITKDHPAKNTGECVKTEQETPAAPASYRVPPASAPAAQKADTHKPESGQVRVLGEAFHTYVIAEDEKGLLLIDKHAAHERMIFNRLRGTTEMPQQRILTPVLAELPPPEAAAVQEHIEEVRKAGFDIEPFGTGSFAVRGAPAYLDTADISSVLSEMAQKLMTNRAAAADALDDLIHMVSCKAAIKAGSHSSMQELQSLCDRVLSDSEITACPHGRPVTVRLTRYELDKLFKRVNQ